MQDVLHLLSVAPLQIFQIYSIGAIFESPTTDSFWSKIVTTHFARLTRFSVHRMLISLDAINDICRRCACLEQLFVVVEQDALVTQQALPYIYALLIPVWLAIGKPWSLLVAGPKVAFCTYQLSVGSTYGLATCVIACGSTGCYSTLQFNCHSVRL